MKLDKRALRALRKRLPHGTITRVATELGVDQSYVSHVLQGSRRNDAILQALIRKAEASERATQRLLERAVGTPNH